MKWTRQLINGFLKVFGDIKVFKWPLFLLYDPGSYRVKGQDVRQVLEQVQPGDILLRGYDHYLDGFFIPGYFSHVGLYVGRISAADKDKITIPAGHSLFKTGEQMVVHAMAEGVFMQDVLDFCRADRIIILRFPDQISFPEPVPEKSVPFGSFSLQEKQNFAKLNNGDQLSFRELFPMIFEVALAQVGKKYDFGFDFKNYNNLSCSEFLYYCIKSLEGYHNLKPTKRKFIMFQKTVVLPDAFIRSTFNLIWKSASVNRKKINKILGSNS